MIDLHLIQIPSIDIVEEDIIVDLILEALGQGQELILDKFFCFLGFYIFFFDLNKIIIWISYYNKITGINIIYDLNGKFTNWKYTRGVE